MAVVIRKDLKYKKGSDRVVSFGYRNKKTGNYDTTGMSAEFIVKSSYATDATMILQQTTDNGGVENTPSAELQFRVSIPRNLAVEPGSYPGEFWCTDAGGARRCLWAGIFTVYRSHLA